MIKILKKKKGISLIEILVGSLMFALIAITVSAVLAPMMMAYSRANDFAEYNTLLDDVGNRLVSELSQASRVIETGDNVLTIVTHNGEISFTIIDGSLMRNGLAVFPPEFYKGKSISFVTGATPPGFTVEVTINPSGSIAGSGLTLPREYAVRPLMIEN